MEAHVNGNWHRVRVKSKSRGDWSEDVHKWGLPRRAEYVRRWLKDAAPLDATATWLLLDRATDDIYIMPEIAVREYITSEFERFLQENGGHRPETFDASHSAIPNEDTEPYRDAWDLLMRR